MTPRAGRVLGRRAPGDRPRPVAAAQRPAHDDHDFEPVWGLPERLPGGERMLWQGSPDWRTLAIEVFHVRAVALYFAVLLAWRGTTTAYDGAGALDTAVTVLTLVPLALLGVGLLATMAWLSARTSVYTVTDRRVVLRIGIVLSVSFNLPYGRLESAALRPLAGGHGDIALTLAPPDRIAYLHLWPHARPWRLAQPEPMLRGVPEAARVAALLADALAGTAQPARMARPEAAPDERLPTSASAAATA